MIVIGVVAIGGALGIALMMYLIARQIHAHDELVAVRADKLEAERARLEAERARLEMETKLLKVQRLAVLGEVTGAVAHELHAPLTAIRETLAALKEIVADRGINRKVTQDTWQAICRAMESAFREGRFEDGAIDGIAAVSELLAQHFPRGAAGPNELPDRAIVL